MRHFLCLFVLLLAPSVLAQRAVAPPTNQITREVIVVPEPKCGFRTIAIA